ncbi:deaminase domain-containing protein [uncultured Clostridium sp.]|uniref:deaminase domain-containing protein n=1 Tax=uncultured Clostridium sp. TaxID=59620 RepID=UPI0026341773|nr:deaminase domain-containing protein [uncultured Clostridium sp.]
MKNDLKRIDIGNIEDLKKVLFILGYNFNEECFLDELKEEFNLSNECIEKIESLDKEGVVYRAKSIEDFILYMELLVSFDSKIKELEKELDRVNELYIFRVEYDRERGLRERKESIDKDLCLEKIQWIKRNIGILEHDDYIEKIEEIYDEIEEGNLFSKDIELLKKLILNDSLIEDYDEEEMIKTFYIKLDGVNKNYIKVKKGGLEYYEHLKKDILRVKRLIKNLSKYLEIRDEKYYLNQSNTVQDAVNIASASFNGVDYKAISGGINLKKYCMAPKEESFKSFKVNKLGEIGIGYNRFNDSEKKIFEKIDDQIEKGLVKSSGEVILYTKLEPCPSCYYVMAQFKEKYPNIDIKINYGKKYC